MAPTISLADKPKTALHDAAARARHLTHGLRTGGPRYDRANRAALVLLALAGLFRLALILHGWPATDSDEAVIGLMARHIVTAHEFPIFFWGQDYMGALQAYLGALFFLPFGSSSIALHLMSLTLTLGFLAAIYALGRAAFGPAAGLLALAWLAFGPSLALLRELQAIGGYQELLLFSALILLGVWARLRHPAPLPQDRAAWRRCLLTYSGIGLAAGVGLWSDLLILPTLVVAFAALVWARPRELLTRAGLVLALAFLVGAGPFLVYNIIKPNATYTEIARQSHPLGAQGLLPTPGDWARQIGSTLSVGLPAVLGSPHLCVAGGDIWSSYPPPLARIARGMNLACDAANATLSGGFLLILALVGWQLGHTAWDWATEAIRREGLLKDLKADEARGRSARGWPPRWEDRLRMLGRLGLALRRAHAAGTAQRRPSAEAAATARLWLRAMLLGTVALSLAMYTITFDAQRYQFTAARYLLPMYLAAPLLAGVLWHIAEPPLRRAGGWLAPRLASHLAWVPVLARLPHAAPPPVARPCLQVRSIVGVVGLALVLGLSMAGGAFTLERARDASTFGAPLPPADQRLITALDGLGAHTFYSDYWTCYRIAFETNERLICAVRGQDGTANLMLENNRYQPYVLALQAEPHPTYVLPAGTPQDANFSDELAQQSLPHDHYARLLVGTYAVYYYQR